MEHHLDFLPVEIAREIKEMRFKQFLGRIERGADADIGRAEQFAPVGQASGDGIDAIGRAQILAHGEVGGREVDRPAHLVAMLDHPANGERPCQQGRGRFAIARLERLAHPARRDDPVVIEHGTDRARRQPMGRAERTQHLDIAAALAPEGEILAGHHARRADPVDQQFANEILRAGAGQRIVEFKDQHAIGPGGGEQFLPLVERGQAEGRRLGIEMADRMGIERGDQRQPPSLRAHRTACSTTA
jgi:hypothetical protein